MYKADRRLYLNSAGQVCEENDPDAQSLLLAAGQSMPLADARKYGLVPDEPEAEAEPDAPAEGKAVAEPPQTKALRAPKGSK